MLSKALKKTISWRIIAFGIASIILYVATGTWQYTPTVLITDVVKTIVYYVHEKVWARF